MIITIVLYLSLEFGITRCLICVTLVLTCCRHPLLGCGLQHCSSSCLVCLIFLLRHSSLSLSTSLMFKEANGVNVFICYIYSSKHHRCRMLYNSFIKRFFQNMWSLSLLAPDNLHAPCNSCIKHVSWNYTLCNQCLLVTNNIKSFKKT